MAISACFQRKHLISRSYSKRRFLHWSLTRNDCKVVKMNINDLLSSYLSQDNSRYFTSLFTNIATAPNFLL